MAGLLAGPASAQTTTLVCETGGGYQIILDVDYTQSTICENTSFGRPPCLTIPARITDRYITFRSQCTNCPPNVIDRQTGFISYAAGGSGKCEATSKERKF